MHAKCDHQRDQAVTHDHPEKSRTCPVPPSLLLASPDAAPSLRRAAARDKVPVPAIFSNCHASPSTPDAACHPRRDGGRHNIPPLRTRAP